MKSAAARVAAVGLACEGRGCLPHPVPFLLAGGWNLLGIDLPSSRPNENRPRACPKKKPPGGVWGKKKDLAALQLEEMVCLQR